jgi:thiol:disulfide interchange protein
MEQLRAFIIAVVVSSVGGYFFLHTEFAKTPQATNLNDIAALDALDFSTEIPWQPFSDANIDTLRSANKAIFIDFTADWCLSCKVNEKNVLNSEAVRQGMQQHNVIPVKADWTRRDESISAWLKRYGKAGVPFYLFISKDGTITALPEVLTTEMVLEAISK